MAPAKWPKLGAATFLALGMLAACGDEEPVEPEVDMEEEEEENDGGY